MTFLRKWLAPAAFFLLVACLQFYWPLFHISTNIPGTPVTDYFHFHWSYWWIRHALTTPGLNVYETNFVMFPATINLALHTWTPFWFPVWAALEPFIGTFAAMNVIATLGLMLTGYTFYLFLRREQVPAGLALVGGLALQLTPAILNAAYKTTLHYLGFFWLPAHLLVWGQVARSTGRRQVMWALVQGVAFYAMLMTDYQYAMYAVFLLLPYGIVTLIEAGTWPKRRRLMILGSLSLVLMLILLWFVGPLPYLLAFDRSTLAPPPAENVHAIQFPEGYFQRFSIYQYNDVASLGSFVVPIFLLTLIASLTVLRNRLPDRRRWLWFALSILPLLLSAGALITVAGVKIPLPYKIVHTLLGGLFRSPDRFGVLFIIPAMIFVGRTWGPLIIWRKSLYLAVTVLLVIIVIIDGSLFEQMPIQDPLPSYSFYQKMGAERGKPYDDYVVLEVPVAAGSGEYWVGDYRDVAMQFYGTIHHKRMVNGLIARVPTTDFWYLRADDPMLSWLGQRRLLDVDKVKQQLRDRIFNWPIGYIVVHQDRIGLDSPTIQEIIGFFNALPDLVCPYIVEKHAVVYRTVWHPDGCPQRTPPEIKPGVYQIDIGSPGDERFIGWGWHYPESIFDVTMRWTGQYPQTLLYVDLPPGSYEISLAAQSFHRPRQLQIAVNGTPLQTTATVPTEGMQTFTFNVPAAVVGSGKHVAVTLNYDAPDKPVDLGVSQDPRPLAIAVDWIRFTKVTQP